MHSAISTPTQTIAAVQIANRCERPPDRKESPTGVGLRTPWYGLNTIRSSGFGTYPESALVHRKSLSRHCQTAPAFSTRTIPPPHPVRSGISRRLRYFDTTARADALHQSLLGSAPAIGFAHSHSAISCTKS